MKKLMILFAAVCGCMMAQAQTIDAISITQGETTDWYSFGKSDRIDVTIYEQGNPVIEGKIYDLTKGNVETAFGTDPLPPIKEAAKKEDKPEIKTESVTEEEPEERPSKWYVTLFKTIGFLLLAILIAILFFFGTIFSFKMLHQSESAPVVYPRAAVLEKDVHGNVINAGDKIVPVLDERINVLVMGTDYGDSEADADEPKRTDAMLLISFGPEDKKVSVLSLPRDTKVILPGHRSAQKLNAAYAFGGVMMAKQTVANLLGVPITHYAIADWRAFIKVVDLIGGVDLLVLTLNGTAKQKQLQYVAEKKRVTEQDVCLLRILKAMSCM